MIKRIAFAVFTMAAGLSCGWAVQLERISPQGAVTQVRDVQVVFQQDAVALGDTRGPTPFVVECDDQAIAGQGRWLNARQWVYEFARPLDAGARCTASAAPDFRDLTGHGIEGPQRYSFSTGGPRVRSRRPWSGEIDEEQIFILSFNAPVEAASVRAHAVCRVEGLGERIAVRLIEAPLRREALEAASMREFVEDPSVQLVQCKRTLPAGADVQLHVGPGVRTLPSAGNEGLAGERSDVFAYTVREPFTAGLACVRENARAPCSPLGKISVNFSAPVGADILGQIVLETPVGLRHADASNPVDSGARESVSFSGPFPELASLTLRLPEHLRDDAGRVLTNAVRFPLAVETGDFPPLVKFASGTFGIIERFGSDAEIGGKRPAMLPLSLRRVGTDLMGQAFALSAGTARDRVTADDLLAFQWYARVQRLDERRLTVAQIEDVRASRALRDEGEKPLYMDTRSVSMFDGQEAARTLALPGLRGDRDAEVIGLPLSEPGLHVIEVESARLGASLLDPPTAMYVRTAVLLTNMAVHIKTGRDDMLVWVTTLENGRPVPDARVSVLSCTGAVLAQGVTDTNGVWHQVERPPAPDYCPETDMSGMFVTARIPAEHPSARGQADFSFALSTWDRGIEPWRFNIHADRSDLPDMAVHTVFDRTLLHAGDTVSMKFFAREMSRHGLENPPVGRLPVRAAIEHRGSGERYDIELAWTLSPSGGQFALARLDLPPAAKLGEYSVSLIGKKLPSDPEWRGDPAYEAGSFRVEAFKVPVLVGTLKLSDMAGDGILVAPESAKMDIQLEYVSGGAAGRVPVSLSAVSRERAVSFAGYDDYVFGVADWMRSGEAEPQSQEAPDGVRRLILDKQPLVLDTHGGAQVPLPSVPSVTEPQSWLFEATFADPNGEIRTIAQETPVWPAAVVAGIRAGAWLSAGRETSVTLLALDVHGKPVSGVAMRLDAKLRTHYSTRKRLVGGFYSYDSFESLSEIGTLCEGRTDSRGELECAVALDQAGNVELYAQAEDAAGRLSHAAVSIWVAGGEAWFGGRDDDRIDVIPSKKTWSPGETAQFQVRMPFRHAHALVAVEREGVLETHVVELSGDDPMIRLPVRASWGPNVYVSVLAVRGRIRAVPWSSFFSWGWQQPREWYHAWSRRVAEAPAPTTIVDLAKPSFRFGVAEIRVADEHDRLKVQVSADRGTYQLRETAHVEVAVQLPDGRPAARGTLAFVAVDEALLALWKNQSWDVLESMRVLRSYGVETASAQGEVVGRRHYGRKAAPAGGGGGFSPTRELVDTLLLWQGDVTLDEHGKARIDVPLNDALTRFRLVAIADFGEHYFGAGYTDIISTQDLQLIPGLPQVVRSGDRYEALATVRNRTTRTLALRVSAQVGGEDFGALELPARNLSVEAGQAAQLSWPVTVPEGPDRIGGATLDWTFSALEQASGALSPARLAEDRVVARQTVVPAVPVVVQHASLRTFDAAEPLQLPVQAPALALQDRDGRVRGGVHVAVQSALAGGLPGVRKWFEAYPYACLEQLGSRAMGLGSQQDWEALMERLPTYLDDDGLAAYFPGGRGSVALTAYLVSISEQARALGWSYGLPNEARQRMRNSLTDFVEGRLEREEWSPYSDTAWRRISALAALSRMGAFQPRMLDSIDIDPAQWPSAVLVDWTMILLRSPDLPSQATYLQQAKQLLRARLTRQGTALVLSDSTADEGWWLMSNRETTQARLLIAMMDQSDWARDVPLLAMGLLGMQQGGAWSTTTANLLGSQAIALFAAHHRTGEPEGRIEVALSQPEQTLRADWTAMPQIDGVRRQDFMLPWARAGRDLLTVTQEGPGQAWATVQVSAALAQPEPVEAGMALSRTVIPVRQAQAGVWSRGDIYRVHVRIRSGVDTVWAVLSDPIPAGATILGSGLGGDSVLAISGEPSRYRYVAPAFVERHAEVFRAYYDVLPQGTTDVFYTVRLNTPGTFLIPATRIEAMYQPDVFGSLPNRPFEVRGQ